MMMKILKVINELPIWAKLLDVALLLTLLYLFSVKLTVVIAAVLLWLVLSAKPGN